MGRVGRVGKDREEKREREEGEGLELGNRKKLIFVSMRSSVI